MVIVKTQEAARAEGGCLDHEKICCRKQNRTLVFGRSRCFSPEQHRKEDNVRLVIGSKKTVQEDMTVQEASDQNYHVV